jgi:hypothetical protein
MRGGSEGRRPVRHRRRNQAYFEPGAGGLSLDRPLSQFSAAAKRSSQPSAGPAMQQGRSGCGRRCARAMRRRHTYYCDGCTDAMSGPAA